LSSLTLDAGNAALLKRQYAPNLAMDITDIMGGNCQVGSSRFSGERDATIIIAFFAGIHVKVIAPASVAPGACDPRKLARNKQLSRKSAAANLAAAYSLN
jgi:hypothetical protein